MLTRLGLFHCVWKKKVLDNEASEELWQSIYDEAFFLPTPPGRPL